MKIAEIFWEIYDNKIESLLKIKLPARANVSSIPGKYRLKLEKKKIFFYFSKYRG